MIVIENSQNLFNQLNLHIKKLNLSNVKVVNTLFKDGFVNDAPYDIIFIDNPLETVPNFIKTQLKKDSGKLIMIKKISLDLSKAYKIIYKNDEYIYNYLFDVFTNYELYKNEKGFVF